MSNYFFRARVVPAAPAIFALILFLGLAPLGYAGAGVVLIGGLSREAKVQPGAKISGIIYLRNVTAEPVEVKVSLADYLFSADGKSSYDPPGSHPRSNATWVVLSPSRLTIQPEVTASVSYTIQAPKDGLSGTYWSVVLVEPVPKSDPEYLATKKDQVSLGIRTVNRYAVLLATDIGETGNEKVAFLDKQLLIKENERILQVDVANIGERQLRPAVWVELYDQQASLVGRFEGLLYRIYPGCSVRYQFPLSGVPAGRYQALFVVDNGGSGVFGAQYVLEIPK